MRVEQAVQGFRPSWQLHKVAFQNLSEGIEQRPYVTSLECTVTRLTPLLKHGGNASCSTDTDITRSDDEIVSVGVRDFGFFVGSDTAILLMPLRHELTDGALGNQWEVTGDKFRVLPGKFYFAAEAEVIADEHGGTSDDASRERLIVAVSESEHPAIIIAGFLPVDFHETEITLTFVAETVRLIADGQVGDRQRSLHGFDQFQMRNGIPSFCG